MPEPDFYDDYLAYEIDFPSYLPISADDRRAILKVYEQLRSQWKAYPSSRHADREYFSTMLAFYANSDGNDIVIVDGRGMPEAFVTYANQLPIRPEVALERAQKWHMKDLYGGVVGEIEGIANDKYIISTRDELHKKGFVLCGFRVNVKTGAVRYVHLKDLAQEHMGRFAKGFIREPELKKYLAAPKGNPQNTE